MKLKSLVIAMSLSTAISTAPVHAEEINTPEKSRAAASGLIIGAVAGGPAGAFVGAVFGGEVFGRLFEQRRENKTLRLKVSNLNASLQKISGEYNQTVKALNEDLDTVLALQAGQSKSQKLPIQFKTASTDIESQYQHALSEIARVLRRNKDATVTLTGFADRRGEPSSNQVLSEERVKGISTFLQNAGVKPRQILGLAFGETRPLNDQETLENNFFDRRVEVELHLDIDPQLATR